MRPVRNLATSSVEMIGTFEQCYLNICVTPSEAHEGVSAGAGGWRRGSWEWREGEQLTAGDGENTFWDDKMF